MKSENKIKYFFVLNCSIIVLYFFIIFCHCLDQLHFLHILCRKQKEPVLFNLFVLLLVMNFYFNRNYFPMIKSLLSSLLQKKYISRNGGEGKENESPVRVLPQTFLLAQ